MGTLYIIATPLGNLEDIGIRAVETLFSVPIILCEDTRKTSFLIHKLSERLKKEPFPDYQLISFYEENEIQKIPRAIGLLQQGANLALVSDAGTPLISDPGYKLVKSCIEAKIKIISIPGASAITNSLTLSGLPTDKFMFIGFLSKKESKIKETLGLLPHKTTIIFFESPFRLIKTLNILFKLLGNINIVICREMTKLYEEVRREKISVAIEHFSKNKPKGEFTCLFRLD